MARATRHFTNDVPFIYLITPPPPRRMRMGSEVLRCVSGYMFLLFRLPYLRRDGTLTAYENIV